MGCKEGSNSLVEASVENSLLADGKNADMLLRIGGSFDELFDAGGRGLAGDEDDSGGELHRTSSTARIPAPYPSSRSTADQTISSKP